MQDREDVEAAALQAICACRYYDLADNIEGASDAQLLAIIEGRDVCEYCGE